MSLSKIREDPLVKCQSICSFADGCKRSVEILIFKECEISRIPSLRHPIEQMQEQMRLGLGINDGLALAHVCGIQIEHHLLY
jgi:hypothetical protein